MVSPWQPIPAPSRSIPVPALEPDGIAYAMNAPTHKKPQAKACTIDAGSAGAGAAGADVVVKCRRPFPLVHTKIRRKLPALENMMSKPNLTPKKLLAVAAAAVSGFAPAEMLVPAAGNPAVRTAPAKQDRAALPVQQSARAAYGIRMVGGGFDPRLFANAYSAPWLAPRYNQRKARRDARRVNRKVAR